MRTRPAAAANIVPGGGAGYFEGGRHVAHPAMCGMRDGMVGGASLAAALKERDSLKGRKLAVTLSGGNVDADLFARVLGGASFAS